VNVVAEQATVYRARSARRRFFTRKSAVRAEAIARIKSKHPTERDETDERGQNIGGGFHWTSLPRADVLLRRVCRLVEAS
jgi:ribonuclease D